MNMPTPTNRSKKKREIGMLRPQEFAVGQVQQRDAGDSSDSPASRWLADARAATRGLAPKNAYGGARLSLGQKREMSKSSSRALLFWAPLFDKSSFTSAIQRRERKWIPTIFGKRMNTSVNEENMSSQKHLCQFCGEEVQKHLGIGNYLGFSAIPITFCENLDKK